ncbi:MAG TPA: mannonate dehydratase [Chloroflexota bacterium]|nr:mannonate dehydratase [Chloroflexota bacterium]
MSLQTPSQKMRIVLGQFNEPSYEKLEFARQLGLSGVLLNTPRLPGETHWEYDDLAKLRDVINSYGLTLEALENTPVKFYIDVMTAGPNRDRQIEHYQTTIRNVGKAGIPILGYHWMPNSVWRTQNSPRVHGRGGARVTVFDMELAKERDAQLSHGRVFSADEMWENYEYFIKRVIPVAEEAGVKLALHPDDPPVPSLGGVARIFSSFEGFKRGSEIVDSPNWGLDFCMGCWSEMGGHENVMRGVKHFVPQGKIYYVHFRDVVGTPDNFAECFLGEGNVNLPVVMKTFKECGFTGFFIDDHVPHMVDDSDWGHRGRAFANGYMLALLNAVNTLG